MDKRFLKNRCYINIGCFLVFYFFYISNIIPTKGAVLQKDVHLKVFKPNDHFLKLKDSPLNGNF